MNLTHTLININGARNKQQWSVTAEHDFYELLHETKTQFTKYIFFEPVNTFYTVRVP